MDEDYKVGEWGIASFKYEKNSNSAVTDAGTF